MLFHRLAERLSKRPLYSYCLFWVITFLIYLPAANAGFVSDTTGWYRSVTQDGFMEYINRTHFGVKSMYQLTQFITWCLYQLAGSSKWAWHLIHISLHAAVCVLLLFFCKKLFENSGVIKAYLPAMAGAVLFCISPYISEVVVWEASFHYMQALILIFATLWLVQQFQDQPKGKWALWAGVLFFLATFTHELWYLTPVLTLMLAVYYRFLPAGSPAVFRKTILFFTLPQIAFFLLHLLLFRLVYGGGIAHVGSGILTNPPGYFLVKMPWYLFHLTVWGRFFPNDLRQAVYHLFQQPAGAILFYAIMSGLVLTLLFRFRKLSGYAKLLSFIFLMLLAAIGLFIPMWFPELLLVVCDRYMYLMLAFYWMLVALLLYRIRAEWLKQGLWLLLAGINLYLNLKLSKKWYESEKVITAIQTSPLLQSPKVKLLLNSPACIKGIPMIGTAPEGEFRLMHNLFFQPPIKDTMLEVAAYNMISPEDGAHVEVMNDSTLKVTLNQWGTWWWLGGFGAFDYENQWFRLELKDPGHWYYVILKQPAATYELLYQQGCRLKEVDMQKRGMEQY